LLLRPGRLGWTVGLAWVLGMGCGWGAEPAGPAPREVVDLTALSLQELMDLKVEKVSTASRFAQPTSEAPAAVSVITSEEIALYGHRTLADVLSGVRGMYVSQDRSYSYLGLRGFSRPSDYNSRFLLLVDGHRVNDNLFGGAPIGRDFVLDIDLIDRVEVVRGPSSSLYGSSAFFGVVNVITKRAVDLQQVEVSAEAGSLDSYRGRFTCASSFPKSGVDFVFSGSFYESVGNESLYFPEFDTPDTNHGRAEDLDHERALNLFTSLKWQDLTLSAAYVSRGKDIPTASWNTLFNDSRYRTTDDRGYVDLKWQRSVDEHHELMARAYFDDYRYSADYPVLPPTPDDFGMTRDDDLGQTVGGEAQWTGRWAAHVFTVGGEVRDHLHQDQAYYEVDPFASYLDDDRSTVDTGLYAQADLGVLPPLRLTAGLRYDHYDTFGDTTNPRLGLIYTPWERTTFKLLYGTAYRAPNAFELYYAVPLESLPNPGLDPEEIQTYEVVYEQKLPGDLQFAVSGYYYRLDSLIEQIESPPGTWMFENTCAAEAKGVETELEWQPAWGLRARASYALQRAEDRGTGDSLRNSPQHLAKLNVLLPLWSDKLFTGVEVQYTGAVETLLDDELSDFWVVNATLFSQKLIRGVELSASLYNLLDEHYAFPGGPGHLPDRLWQDGRSFRVKLTYRY
jgi:iron complex outermembrane receptor protein